jgi:hypothetical protein
MCAIFRAAVRTLIGARFATGCGCLLSGACLGDQREDGGWVGGGDEVSHRAKVFLTRWQTSDVLTAATLEIVCIHMLLAKIRLSDEPAFELYMLRNAPCQCFQFVQLLCAQWRRGSVCGGHLQSLSFWEVVAGAATPLGNLGHPFAFAFLTLSSSVAVAEVVHLFKSERL